MAPSAEIPKKEGERSELRDFQKIYLFVEGSFCHAYEVSAWLYSRTASDSLKVRRQKSKSYSDGSFVIVGNPPEEKSFSKYAPKGSTMVQEGFLCFLMLINVIIEITKSV